MALIQAGLFGAPTRTGYVLLALAAFFWGLYGPLSRYFLFLGLESSEIAFLRCLVGCVCFGLHAACRGSCRMAGGDVLKSLIFGLVGLGMLNMSYQLAVRETGAALAAILLYTAPAWVALMSVLFFRHKLTWLYLFAMCTAMLGVALVTLTGSTGQAPSILGVLCGLASAFFYALHFPWNYHWRGKYSPIVLYFYAMLGGALLLFPFAGLTAKPLLVYLQVLLGLVLVTYVPYLCYGLGMRSVSPTPAAIIVNLEPVVACIVAALWLNERFTLSGWLGTALVLGVVFLLVIGSEKHKADSQ